MAKLFETTIGGNCTALNLLEENINNLIGNINVALIDTTSEVRGKERKKKKRTRVTNDTLDPCDKRRSLKKSGKVTRWQCKTKVKCK